MSALRFWSLQAAMGMMCVALLYAIFTGGHAPDIPLPSGPTIANFKTLLVSIVLEALPFILLGVAVSAALQALVSEETVRRWTPRHPVAGIVFGCLLGFLFPLCECGMIPIVRRLIRKGMSPYIGVVFILAGPILNPVVFASTHMAFRSRPEMAYTRLGLAFAVAFAVGLVIWRTVRASPLRDADEGASPSARIAHVLDHAHAHEHSHAHDHPYAHESAHGDVRLAPIRPRERDHGARGHHAHDHGSCGHDHAHAGHSRGGSRLLDMLSHASDEFFDMGKYLIFGATITALLQAFVDRESLLAVGQGPYVSHLFMMGLAFIMSICSTSDAFVASSFATTFPFGPLLAFLVFGPMLDLKNTLMLLSVFRTRFVAWLALWVTGFTLCFVLLFEKIRNALGVS